MQKIYLVHDDACLNDVYYMCLKFLSATAPSEEFSEVDENHDADVFETSQDTSQGLRAKSFSDRVALKQLEVIEAQLEAAKATTRAANATTEAMAEVKSAVNEIRAFCSVVTTSPDRFSFLKFLNETNR